jgi:phage/plasmid-associated DNA primase
LLENLVQCKLERQVYESQVGLALLGDTRVQKAILIVGPPGCGKSTLLEHTLSTCGHSKANGAGSELFTQDDTGANARAHHLGDRVTIVDEFPSVAVARDENLFKRMVTHDAVRCKILYQDTGDHQWTPKLIFATNDIPQFADASGAIKRRIYPIQCGEPIREPDIYYADKLMSERSAWARKCIVCALAILGHFGGSLPECEHVEEFIAAIAAEGDPIKSWVHEECELGDPRYYMERPDILHEAWRRWQFRNDEQKVGRYTFIKKLLAYAPYGLKRGRDCRKGEDVDVIRGIRLREETRVKLASTIE